MWTKIENILAHDRTWKFLVWGHIGIVTPLVLGNLVGQFMGWWGPLTVGQTYALATTAFWVTLSFLLLSLWAGATRTRKSYQEAMKDLDAAHAKFRRIALSLHTEIQRQEEQGLDRALDRPLN